MPLVKKWQLDKHVDDSDIHHRKWSWADEQGFRRCFVLPFAFVKYGSVFLPSGQAGKFDRDWVEHPCVVRVGNYYYLFYDGTNTTESLPPSVGVARFTDPKGTYTRLNSGNSLIGNNEAVPSVLYDFYETDANRKWKMWTMATSGHPAGSYHILYRYSAYPDSGWSAYADIGLVGGTFGHSVFKIGNLYCCFLPQAIGSGLKLWTSTNPSSGFSDQGVVLDIGSAGEWDVAQVRYVTITYILGTYYLFYTGRNASYLRIGMAMSPFCALGQSAGYGHKFWKYRLNPILLEASSNLLSPSLLQVEDGFYLWYEDYAVQGVKLATIP